MSLSRPLLITLSALALGTVAVPAAPLAAEPAAPTLIGAAGTHEVERRVGPARRWDRWQRTGRGTAGSSSFRFDTLIDGRPVRMDPCAPIRWSSSTARGPVGGVAVLKEAVARVAAVSGTTWTYVGPTAAEPGTRLLPRAPAASYPPVVLGWSDASRSDLLARTQPSTLGVTQTQWFGMAYADGTRRAKAVGAVVALDRTERLPLRGGLSWKTVALHELGHAMGLDHVEDNSQLMDTGLSRTLTDLQAGDRNGLIRAGRAGGCVRVPGI